MGEGGFLQPLQAGGKPPSAPSRGLLQRNGQPLSPSILCRDGPRSRRGQGWRLPRPLPGVQGAAALRCPYLAPPLCACPPGCLCVSPLLFSQGRQPRWVQAHPNGLILTYSSKAVSPTAGGGVGVSPTNVQGRDSAFHAFTEGLFETVVYTVCPRFPTPCSVLNMPQSGFCPQP